MNAHLRNNGLTLLFHEKLQIILLVKHNTCLFVTKKKQGCNYLVLIIIISKET